MKIIQKHSLCKIKYFVNGFLGNLCQKLEENFCIQYFYIDVAQQKKKIFGKCLKQVEFLYEKREILRIYFFYQTMRI